jgi:MFS family permease
MGPLPPPLGNLLAPQPEARAYQLALIVAGLLAVPSLVPLFLLDPDPRPQPGAASSQTVGRSLPGRLGDLGRKVGARWRRWPDWKVWRAWLGSALVLLTLEQGLIGFGAGLFIPYFNLFFVRHLGADPWQFGLIDGLATALTAGATLLAPWLASRLGKARAVVLTQALSLPLMLVLGFSHSLWLAALLYPLRQGAMDMTMGVLQAFSMEVIPAQWRGLANSSYQAAYWIAYSLSTPLGGIIIVQQGYPTIFVLAAISYGLSILALYFCIPREIDERGSDLRSGRADHKADQQNG